MEKISIIVPVYKVEPYLRQCIDSILSQTYPHFELILIDDGSPDSCGSICDEYASRDPRITVIHQENGGLSAARNAGLDWVFAHSESSWITFVDSDDALSPIMLEMLRKEAVRNQADIAQTYGEFFSDPTELIRKGTYIGAISCFPGKKLAESYYKGETMVTVMTWGKLFRRELFQELRFPVGKIHEDQATTPILLFHAEKVVLIRSWLYYYRQREGSITHEVFSLKRLDDVDAVASCASYFKAQSQKHLAKLAGRYCSRLWARLTFTARQEGIYDQVPPKYRMGILRAGLIILGSSLRRGGMTFAAQRIRKLIGQRKR